MITRRPRCQSRRNPHCLQQGLGGDLDQPSRKNSYINKTAWASDRVLEDARTSLHMQTNTSQLSQSTFHTGGPSSTNTSFIQGMLWVLIVTPFQSGCKWRKTRYWRYWLRARRWEVAEAELTLELRVSAAVPPSLRHSWLPRPDAGFSLFQAIRTILPGSLLTAPFADRPGHSLDRGRSQAGEVLHIKPDRALSLSFQREHT